MNTKKLEKLVIDQYRKTYNQWSNIEVTKIVNLPYAGKLVVVHALNDGEPIEPEVCHVSSEGHVTIFSSSENLAVHLQQQINQRWQDKVFSQTSIAAFVMLTLLLTLAISALMPLVGNPTALDILGKAFIAATAFYFGSTAKPSPDA